MRVTTSLLVICCISLIAMAVGAPRPCAPNCKSNKNGKSGERKRNRSKNKKNDATIHVTTTTEAYGSKTRRNPFENFELLDNNGDGWVTKKEYKTHIANGNPSRIFELADLNGDKRISKDEILRFQEYIELPTVKCDIIAMEQCAEKFSEHLRIQEEHNRTAGRTLSFNGLFCTVLQVYVNCIAEKKHYCTELETYAQRIKRTSTAYRNAGICPDMNTALFNQQQNLNPNSHHHSDPENGERRRRSPRSRTAMTHQRTLNEECLKTSFAVCHDELFGSIRDDNRGCTLTKKYWNCIRKSTKGCRDKTFVKKIVSGLKYIRKIHREAEICGLQT